MSSVVLVPRRRDHGHRDRLWAYCESLWLAGGWNVVTGSHETDGPFSAAHAFNRAARTAIDTLHPDVLVLMGADHVPDHYAAEAAVRAARSHGWAPVFASTGGISRTSTERLLTGETAPSQVRPVQVAPFCTALLAVRTDVWTEIGGFDERFAGWGCEDVAFRMVLDTLYPDPPKPDPNSIVYALWHEAAPRDCFLANATLIGEYHTAAAAGPEAMRSYLAGLR